MKQIKLTRGWVASVDDEDYDFLSQWEWRVQINDNCQYAVRGIRTNGNYKLIKMHRIIMDVPCEMDIDHIDHNGLNNQKSNLRICTKAQNLKNRRASGRSKYLGVTIDRRGYILAKIGVDGNKYYLGKFKTEEEAAVAYDEAASKIHGEFANLNFPFVKKRNS